jgi:hypothetical protein
VDQPAVDLDEYVYTRNDLWRDYLRAFLGLAICIAPFIWLDPALVFIIILLGIGAVFATLLWQTVVRQFTRVRMDEQGITMIAFRRRTIAWDQLRQFQLSYFTTGKNMQGFMEIKLKGPGVSMNIGSSLIGFHDIARTGSQAAVRNGVVLKAATIDNLTHISIDPFYELDQEDGR